VWRIDVARVEVEGGGAKVPGWLETVVSILSRSRDTIGCKSLPLFQAHLGLSLGLFVKDVDCPVKNKGEVLIYTLNQTLSIFHWDQAAPTRYRD